MGQYYMAVNLDRQEALDPIDIGCSGMKLTETCYVGNEFADALTYLLANDWHGDRVVFCGDYAWECMRDEPWADTLRGLADGDPYARSRAFKSRSGDFAAARGGTTLVELPDGTFRNVPIVGEFSIAPETSRYVVNETLGVFYDREEAPVAWIAHVDGEPRIARTDPLTLFLALGNGLGGGDYIADCASNIDLVGSWAGHVIGASVERPEDLRKIDCPFDERGIHLTASDESIKEAMAASDRDWTRASLAEIKEAVAAIEACRGIANPSGLEPKKLLMEVMSTWNITEGEYPPNNGEPFDIEAIAESHLLDDAFFTVVIRDGAPSLVSDLPDLMKTNELLLEPGAEEVASFSFRDLYQALEAVPGAISDGMITTWDLDAFACRECSEGTPDALERPGSAGASLEGVAGEKVEESAANSDPEPGGDGCGPMTDR